MPRFPTGRTSPLTAVAGSLLHEDCAPLVPPAVRSRRARRGQTFLTWTEAHGRARHLPRTEVERRRCHCCWRRLPYRDDSRTVSLADLFAQALQGFLGLDRGGWDRSPLLLLACPALGGESSTSPYSPPAGLTPRSSALSHHADSRSRPATTTAGASHQTGRGPTRQPFWRGADIGARRGFLRRIPLEPTPTVGPDACR